MIIYLISCYRRVNTGTGGHYQSIKTISEEISDKTDVIVFSIGDMYPEALAKLENHQHIQTNLSTIEFAILKISKIIKNLHVTAVHSFDVNSSYVGKSLAIIKNVNFFLTKCGGPPPKWHFPYTENLYIYHEQDKVALNKTVLFKPDSIKILPNRVRPPNYDIHRAFRTLGPKHSDQIVFLRICRIGSYYLDSIQKTIELSRLASEQGIKARTIIIGKPECEHTASLLIESNPTVEFFTEPEEYVNAAELLGYSDYVVATGRGAVEAIASGKVTFIPTSRDTLPTLLNSEKFSEAMRENFSHRCHFPNSKNSAEAIKIFLDEKEQNKVTQDNIAFFNKNLHVDFAVTQLTIDYNTKKRIHIFRSLASLILQRIRLYGISIKITIKKIK